jgi:DNA invertase Pin-like site-specific DNA recombinase
MSVAQWERETIGERTSTALQYKKSQGQHIGSVPYGYESIDKTLAVVESEAAAIALIQEMREQGAKLQTIADELNAQSIATKRGGKWYATSVKNVLERAA